MSVMKMPKYDFLKKILFLQGVVDQSHDNLIAGYERKIILSYKKALEENKKKIAAMYEKYGDKVSHADMTSYNRLAVLQKEIAIQLRDLTGENINTTISAIKDSFTNSYYRTAYSFESGLGIKLGFGQLNPDVISASVLNPLDSIKWTAREKDHISKLSNEISGEITQGLIQGKGYSQIAQGITKRTEIAVSKALTIARTEAGRAQSTARVLAYEKAEAAADRLGIKIARVWVSTLDIRTRDSHRSMDGQHADENGMFTLPSGTKTPGPRLSGIAKEDINCRCTTRMEILDVPAKVRKDNIDKSIIKNMSYEEWASEKGIRLRKSSLNI